jgi:hypothetical protein
MSSLLELTQPLICGVHDQNATQHQRHHPDGMKSAPRGTDGSQKPECRHGLDIRWVAGPELPQDRIHQGRQDAG